MADDRIAPGALKHRVMRAGSWSMALQTGEILFGLLRTIVLARLLAPDDFGLFAIAAMSLLAMDTLTRTGFEQAMVQKRENIDALLNTAWSVHVLRGVVLAVLLFVLAPVVAGFFKADEALWLVRAIGVCLLFEGLTNVAVVSFQKDLEFHKEFAFRFSGIVADLVVAVVAAVVLGNAWALVYGMVANYAVRMVASYLAHPYRPSFHLDRKVASGLFAYGKWMLLASILLFIGLRGPDMTVAKMLGVTALGFFQLAGRIPQTVVSAVIRAINGVAFPTYAGLQSDPKRMAGVYLKIAGCSCCLIIPLTLGLLAMGGEFTSVFLGERWVPMVPVLLLLSVAAGVNGIRSTGRPVFMGLGRPKILFHMQVARVAGLLALLIPFTLWWGIVGAATAALCSRVCGFSVFYVYLTRSLPLGGRDLLRITILPLAASLCMYAALALTDGTWAGHFQGMVAGEVVLFFLRIAAGGLLYVGLLLLGLKLLPDAHPLRGTMQVLFSLKERT